MQFERQSGVFLHITALPGPHGIGDLGEGAHEYIDWLASANQSVWQFCPIGPTATIHGDSPYQSYSAFAGNPLLVSLDTLSEQAYFSLNDVSIDAPDARHEVEYDTVRKFKTAALRTAAESFFDEFGPTKSFERFCESQSAWLDDYALFMSLHDALEGAWTEWPEPIRTHESAAVEHYRDKLESDIAYRKFVQFVFDRQWRELHQKATDAGVTLVGDLPIYVALDSADVWADPEAFELNDANQPSAVAGVPPTESDAGQRWGNPLYDWEHLRETNYEWWISRLKRLFELVDITRIDHFKGFESYWSIPADADSPGAGEWKSGPGKDFFDTVAARLGQLPFIVEDLGHIDQSLHELRESLSFPGMRVPQYADWCQEGDMYQPMHYPRQCVAYTATHDTNTTVGYYDSLSARQKDCLHYNLGIDGDEINWSLIDAVWRSDAIIAMTTMQDILGLDSHARLNTPGTAIGNWQWRCTSEGLSDALAGRLAALSAEHIRD
jgi:4-alpha-glucanotransferase